MLYFIQCYESKLNYLNQDPVTRFCLLGPRSGSYQVSKTFDFFNLRKNKKKLEANFNKQLKL